MKLRIYGWSDDLVEVESQCGTVDEEFDAYRGAFIELSTGDVFGVEYGDDGLWHVEHVEDSGLLKVRIVGAPSDCGTETAEVEGDVLWADGWLSNPPELSEVLAKIESVVDAGGCVRGGCLRIGTSEAQSDLSAQLWR